MSATAAPIEESAAQPTNLPVAKGSPETAAIILSLLEPETAKAVAAYFDEGRLDRALDAYERLDMVDQAEMLSVVRSFNATLDGDLPVISGGTKRAASLRRLFSSQEELPALPGPDQEDEPLADPGSIAEGAEPEEVWRYVAALSPDKAVSLLQGERPGLVAAVLSRLSRDSAVAVLGSLDDATAARILLISLGEHAPTEDTYDAIAETLRQRAPSRLESVGLDTKAMLTRTSALLNAMQPRRQAALMKGIEQAAPAAHEQLAPNVLRFSTLPERLPKTIVPALFREMDDEVTDRALKLALETEVPVAEFLLSCISQRLAEMIRERVRERPAVSREEGEEAQALLMQTLVDWAEEDRFAFKPPKG
ncbi:hypothetical protein HK107_13290 [Parvularcula sp. ZS-1/3]|uniref:Flagellar motor switch protein FliG n=1 Tax=Parvularcula mediterranea TaxID=2732508 RepID=A0A7Y3RNG7_9PROT|nr:FliG C-terminal domain-containing protein [Parvularcula mediterranea]NNU17299.1 hypothetical protein [Parvularcula mediterranea]